MSAHFLVFRKPGPSWAAGVPTRQQPLWDEHAAFMDRLFAEGRVIMAGPYSDWSRALIIMEGRDVEEITTLFRSDPWAKAGILIPDEIVEWIIFLDSRKQPNSPSNYLHE